MEKKKESMLDLDAMFEPIKFKLGGKLYTVDGFSQDTINRSQEFALKADAAFRDPKVAAEKGEPEPEGQDAGAGYIREMLGVLTGIEPDTFKNADVRKLRALSQFLQRAAMAEENPLDPKVESESGKQPSTTG